MESLLTWIWAALIFGSLAWYSYLLFHVGWRGGKDIIVMARELSRRQDH